MSFLKRGFAQVVSMRLTRNMRVEMASGSEAEALRGYANFLLRVGNGAEPTISSNDRDDHIQVPQEMVVDTIKSLVDFILPDLVRIPAVHFISCNRLGMQQSTTIPEQPCQLGQPRDSSPKERNCRQHQQSGLGKISGGCGSQCPQLN